MHSLIIGGGKIGYYLTKVLIEKGYDVSVVEKEKDACQKFANDLNITVIKGDGTSVSVLEQAGVADADSVIAVTGRDEDNLVACQLAKRLYQVKKTIAKVNNPKIVIDPKNVEALKKLGVDIVVSSTDNITGQLEREIDSGKIKELLPLGAGNAGVFEIVLDNSFTLQNVPLMEMEIPLTLNIISIIRNETELIIPRGHATLEIGDKLMILSKIKDKNDIFKALKIKA